MKISAKDFNNEQLNDKIRHAAEDVVVTDCCGERFIGCSAKDKKIDIYGTPGNALGAYLFGGVINVYGNAQDAVGDTMDDGTIIIHGSAGDTLGYAMRGGKIFVEKNAGYRTGIHMKEFQEKFPVIVIGGSVGSFLGEYQAGGILVVLGLDSDVLPVGNFTGTGMHGGKIFIRSEKPLTGLPAQVIKTEAQKEQLEEIMPYLEEFCAYFDKDIKEILDSQFYLLTPNAKNPYKQLYTTN